MAAACPRYRPTAKIASTRHVAGSHAFFVIGRTVRVATRSERLKETQGAVASSGSGMFRNASSVKEGEMLKETVRTPALPTSLSRPQPPMIQFPDRRFFGFPRVCALYIRTSATVWKPDNGGLRPRH